MKKTISISILVLSTITLLTGCETMTMNTRPQVPQNTVGSINFVQNPGSKNFEVIVLNKRGKPFPVDVKPIPNEKAKKTDQAPNEVRLFFVDGSCTVKVCLPGRICQPVTIEDDAKCAALGQ